MNPTQFRSMVGGVLLVGVVVSSALMTLGLIGSFAVGWNGSLRGLPAQTASGTNFSGIGAGLVALRPIAFAQVGLLVLIATPVVRVIASVVGFSLERDLLYVGITLAVLAILLLSLFGLR